MPPLAVVTGASSGIGFHVAGQLGLLGYKVLLGCRNRASEPDVLQSLNDWYGQDGKKLPLEFCDLELSSFSSVRAFAANVASRKDPLQILVCNAGVNSNSVPHEPERQLSQDGVDVLYQTNFLSHFLLVLLLLPVLRAARGRVVSVTSVAHRGAKRKHLGLVRQVRRPYKSLYSLSKFAQIAASEELYRRFSDRFGVSFHCVNPGGVATDVWRGHSPWRQFLCEQVLVEAETAGQTVVRACICDEGKSPAQPRYWNGYKLASRLPLCEYWSPFAAGEKLVCSQPSSDARNPAIASQVWDESVAVLDAAGIDVVDDGSELSVCFKC